MEANSVPPPAERQMTTIWTPGIYGLGDHLFDCLCCHLSPLNLGQTCFWEGRYLDASMLLPLHRGTTPHLPIGDHHRLRPEPFTTAAWPDLKHWLSIKVPCRASPIPSPTNTAEGN